MKLLLIRSCVACMGAAALVVAQLAQSREAVWAAFVLLAIAETLALASLTRRHESPSSRALLGLGEALPGLAVSLLEPAAMLVALAQVVYSVIASGIATVSASLGKPLGQPHGEAMRRLLAVAANAGLGVIVLEAAGAWTTHAILGLGTREVALLCMALVVVGSARALSDLAMNAKWTK